jgi:hypothetical protein
MAAVEEKSMVPTILVGIGGTGAEVLSRVRRLVVETYGSLDKFPILGFLAIDTDKDYKISNPEAAGPPFKDNERHWARVTGRQAEDVVADMDKYPWIQRWFPTELQRNLTSLEAGAGQVRACGRFAFFMNYHDIRDKFKAVMSNVQRRENYMQDTYNVKVAGNQINVFVTGSLSGGTGSGMLIDIAYAIRDWTKGESCSMTAVVPMPNAFAGIKVGDRVLANGYAALMELSYFSDHRTEYNVSFSSGTVDEINNKKAPFDFTYLVGTKNENVNFKLDQVREIIAQHIFLDMTSDFAPHKRSIRDNIKGSWAQPDPGGRSYPRCFMSFGLSTIEIPIAQIRTSLANRLATDLVSWWLNDRVMLPPQMLDLVRDQMLKTMRLTANELLGDLSAAQDQPYTAVISKWVNSIRTEISNQNLLECTSQGANLIGSERGKIMQFNNYLTDKVDEYGRDHLRDQTPDRRAHGDYFTRMYGNADEVTIRARKALEEELYAILTDRTRGPKFAEQFLILVRQIFTDAAEKYRREQDNVWAKNEDNRLKQYNAALQEIVEFRDKYGLTKQSNMEKFAEEALIGIEGHFCAKIQRKARALGLEVLARLDEQVTDLERRLNRFTQRLIELRDGFKEQSDRQADSADVLDINGVKLFERDAMNGLYDDLLEQFAGLNEGARARREVGLDATCGTMSEDILKTASPLWKDNRSANEVMRLWDMTEIPDAKREDLRELISNRTRQEIMRAPEGSRLRMELAACDLLYRTYNDEESLKNNLRIAVNKSQPLLLLSKPTMQGADAGFTPSHNLNAAILGGPRTADPAAQKVLKLLPEFVGSEDNIKPLGDPERHRMVFVQEMGGFSLRCIDGMRELRQSYQDWLGEMIVAKRAQLKGESRELPIPVHLQKEAPFWDVFPEDARVYKTVVLARALGLLWEDVNASTKEPTIRYQVDNNFGGKDNIDVASTWDEAVQVLEVRACQADRAAIDHQIDQKLTQAETEEQKAAIAQTFKQYLDRRAIDLDKLGGKDSPIYRREAKIISDIFTQFKLKGVAIEVPPDPTPIVTPQPEPMPTPQPESVLPPPPVVKPVGFDPAAVVARLQAKLAQIDGLEQAGLLDQAACESAKTKLQGKFEQLTEMYREDLMDLSQYSAALDKLLGA